MSTTMAQTLRARIARTLSQREAGELLERVQRGEIKVSAYDRDDLALRATLSAESWRRLCEDEDRKMGLRPRRCDECRKAYEAVRSTSRFCSTRCQKRAKRRAA